MTHAEIQRQLDADGGCILPGGVTEIGDTLVVRAGGYLTGSHTTVLRKYGVTPAIMWDGDNVQVSNVVVDGCGEMVNGLIGYGSHNAVRYVTVRNHTSTTESFAILMDSNGAEHFDNVIEDCVVRDFVGTYNGGISIASQKALVHGTVRRCTWIGPATPPADARPPYGCIGAELMEDCVSYNALVGTYTEGCMATQVIRRNRFYGVRAAALRINLALPQSAVLFEDNVIDLTPDGVAFQVCNNPIKLDSLTVRRNVVVGGYAFDINAATGLHLEGNVGGAFGHVTGSGYAERNRGPGWHAADGNFKNKLKTAP